jgi:hypothetical protein
MVIREQRFSFNHVREVLGGVLGQDLHAKRVDSLCDATLGVLRSSSLAVCMIGQGLAAARGLSPKHATKQVDRLLSNPMINVDDILVRWVPYIVGARDAIVVALDWTDFDADKQATIMLSLITDHGRATPLVWLTVNKNTLKNNRSLYEHRVLVRLAELLPADIKVCVVADRGFGDQKLYRMLTEELYFDYVIRFRGNIAVTATTGETRTAAAWVRPGGRARVLRGATVTADRYAVGTVDALLKVKLVFCGDESPFPFDATPSGKHVCRKYGPAHPHEGLPRWVHRDLPPPSLRCAPRALRFGAGPSYGLPGQSEAPLAGRLSDSHERQKTTDSVRPHSSSCGWDRNSNLWSLLDQSEDLARNVALHAPNGFELGMAFGYSLCDISLRAGIGPQPTNGNNVQRAVGGSVTTPAESMACCLAG